MADIGKDMKWIAIINDVNTNQYAHKSFLGGESPKERVLGKLKALSSHFPTIMLSEAPGDIKENKDLLKALGSLSEGYDHILYFWEDCPFYDTDLIEEMVDVHKKRYAEYSFADGYPYGLAPEILAGSIIPALIKIAPDEKISRSSILNTIMKDINSFDIETHISEKDYRGYRLNLTCDSLANFSLCESIGQACREDFSLLRDRLETLEPLFRTRPYYYQFQIFQGNPQQSDYDLFYKSIPEKKDSKLEIPLNRWADILKDIVEFTPEAVIGLGVFGEPSFHSRIKEVIQEVLQYPGFNLVIETSGLGWSIDDLENLRTQEGFDRIEWIVLLDSFQPELYSKIRGQGFDEAIETLNWLLTNNKGNTYVQAMRLKEYEEYLEGFYRKAKELTDQVIIQKYNHYSGRQKDRRVTDLKPLKRNVCWHLKRELVTLADLSAHPCVDSFMGEMSLGNWDSSSLPELWRAAEQLYTRHLNEEYPEICKNCDEYYTFNF